MKWRGRVEPIRLLLIELVVALGLVPPSAIADQVGCYYSFDSQYCSSSPLACFESFDTNAEFYGLSVAYLCDDRNYFQGTLGDCQNLLTQYESTFTQWEAVYQECTTILQSYVDYCGDAGSKLDAWQRSAETCSAQYNELITRINMNALDLEVERVKNSRARKRISRLRKTCGTRCSGL